MSLPGRILAWFSTPTGAHVALLMRLVVASVFAFAAYPKLLDPTLFARDVDNYRLLPDAFIGPLAVLLPPLEVTCVVGLVTGIHKRGAALVTSGMLLAFAIGMIQAIVRGIDLDCGCFGHFVEAQVSWWTVLRNISLIALLVPTLFATEPASRPTASNVQ